MIDTLKGGALLFAYYPDRKWLAESSFLACGAASGRSAASPAPAEALGTGRSDPLRPYAGSGASESMHALVRRHRPAPGTLERARAG